MALLDFLDEFNEGAIDFSDRENSRAFLSEYLTTDDSSLYTGEQVLNQFRALGGKIGTQAFYDLKREVLGLDISASAITGVSLDRIPRLETFRLTDEYLPQNFLYVVDYEQQDTTTGKIFSKSFPVYINERTALSDIYDIAEIQIGELYPNAEIDQSSISVSRAYRNQDAE